MSDLATYFSVVYKHTPSTAFVQLTTILNNRTHTQHYRYGTQLDQLAVQIAKLSDTTNVYLRITPLLKEPPAGKRGLEKDSAGSSVLWTDLDCYGNKTAALGTLRSFLRPPTLIVDSGGGLHAYWLLERFSDDLLAVKARNKWLYQQLRTSDADAVYDLARLLRAPTSFNLKYTPPLQAVIVHYDPQAIYKLSDFEAETLEEVPQITVWDNVPLNGRFASDVSDRDRKLYSLMTEELKAKKMFPDGSGGLDRSTNDAYCVTKLLALGYTPEQCMTVLIDPRYTTSLKYRETHRFDYVTITVNKVYNYFINSIDRYFQKTRFQAKEMAEPIVGEQRQFIYTADSIWQYTNGRYIRNAENVIKSEVVKRLGNRWNTHCEDETLAYIRSAYYVPIEQCNQQSNEYVNCRNGMLNITNGNLEPHDQNYRSLYQLPANYDPDADTTLVDWFVKSLFPEDTIPFFWEYLGSSLLTSQYWPKAFLLLVGAGDTGKSTMLRFIRSILGDDNCSAVTLQALADNRFAVVKLYGKLANIFADLSETEAGDVGQIKAITGDDVLHGEEKFQKGFDFKPTARLIFSANHYPTIRNADQAFFNRAKLIRCSNQFRGKKANEGLSTQLALQENLNAALLRMYQGLKRVIANKDFTASVSMQSELDAYQDYADSVYGFLEQCRYDPFFITTKQELYRAYSDTCNAANRSKVTANSFHRRLNDQAAKRGITERRPEINGGRERCYVGIKPPKDEYKFYIAKSLGN